MKGLLMWSIGKFLSEFQKNSSSWVNTVVMIIGLAMLGFAAYKIARGVISKKGDTNWVMVIIMIVLGAYMFANGTSSLTTLGNTGKDAVVKMGGDDRHGMPSSTILWYLP